jgi:hypothetical protein
MRDMSGYADGGEYRSGGKVSVGVAEGDGGWMSVVMGSAGLEPFFAGKANEMDWGWGVGLEGSRIGLTPSSGEAAKTGEADGAVSCRRRLPELVRGP